MELHTIIETGEEYTFEIMVLEKTYLQLYGHTCTLEIHANIYSFLW